MDTIIWHNPRCSKSRQTLALLQERGIEPEVRLYLEAPPSSGELADVIARLGIDPWALLRRGEAVFKELGLSKDSGSRTIIEAMCQHPILIERPVVIRGDRAALGRPPETVLTLLD
jgi:arsenate reductase